MILIWALENWLDFHFFLTKVPIFQKSMNIVQKLPRWEWFGVSETRHPIWKLCSNVKPLFSASQNILIRVPENGRKYNFREITFGQKHFFFLNLRAWKERTPYSLTFEPLSIWTGCKFWEILQILMVVSTRRITTSTTRTKRNAITWVLRKIALYQTLQWFF